MIKELINALKAGEQLENRATWKNYQASTGAVSALVGAAFMVAHLVGVKIEATPEQVAAISGAIAFILGLFNGYTTVATSASVGLRPVDQGNTPTGMGSQNNDNPGS